MLVLFEYFRGLAGNGNQLCRDKQELHLVPMIRKVVWLGYGVSFWSDENVSNIDCGAMLIAVPLCEYTKNHGIAHFKMVNFVV